jgi:hypothetical protein
MFLRRLRNFFVAIGNGMLPAYLRVARRWLATHDHWEEVPHPVPHRLFGLGSKHHFSWYLEGECQVQVASVEEIQRWLLQCSYHGDQKLFRDPDFWQHPAMFEKLRKGDCEDHAIWAWRKLKDLGIPARLYTGRVLSPVNGGAGFHAWVVYEQDGKRWLLETVAFHRSRMSRALDEARAEYVPHFSIDHALSTSIYCGFAHSGRTLNRRAREAARAPG